MKKINFVFITLIASLLFVSCDKELTESNNKEIGKLAFSISKEHNALAGISLKAGEAYNLDLVSEAIITIEKDGVVVEGFDSKTLTISSWGDGNYTTPDIQLEVATGYSLTKFELKNADGLMIFASPTTGEAGAENVDNPLPLSFDIALDATTPIDVEVLSTEV